MYPVLKRIFDLLLATIALLLLSPVLIPVIIILLFTGEKEVFYFQKRIGFKNKPFDIWKFATMVKNSPNIGTGEITLRNDPRVTPVGRFLRKTKINELPQILNVITGDMSIVGPRPLMEVSFKLYDESSQRLIYSVKPGITGIGSLVFRDEEKILSESSNPRETYNQLFPYKAALEAWYRQNASLLTDCKIVFLTAWLILFPHSRHVAKMFPGLPARPVFN
jgi:lipopolysaccharide/colanic/teichoic acid biosynthesis glycosyltransferase